jgi:hypothetical protein
MPVRWSCAWVSALDKIMPRPGYKVQKYLTRLPIRWSKELPHFNFPNTSTRRHRTSSAKNKQDGQSHTILWLSVAADSTEQF